MNPDGPPIVSFMLPFGPPKSHLTHDLACGSDDPSTNTARQVSNCSIIIESTDPMPSGWCDPRGYYTWPFTNIERAGEVRSP
jgi:hypothetical protein